jgi:hypothetical protein
LVKGLALNCSKRGQYVQLAFLVVILFAIGIIYLALQMATEDINTSLQGEADFGAEAQAAMQSQTDSTGSVFDSSIAIVLVGVWLLCMGLAYNSQGSPLLLVVALFIIVALGFVGMILSNSWEEFSESGGFTDVADSYPITNFVLTNYLIFVIVLGFTTLLVGMSRGGGF